MHVRIHKSLAISRPRRALLAILLAMAVVAATAASVGAQWPTGCEELNDIVERHLGNDGNVGIYQLVFGDLAEDACQNDHLEDVRGVFAWVFDSLPTSESTADGTVADIGGWPTTCVELNDIVERNLENEDNVGIYQRVFLNEADAGCRSDHLEDVQTTFAWARPPNKLSPTRSDTPPIGDFAQSNPALQQLLSRLPGLRNHIYEWLSDGISRHELSAIHYLHNLAVDDPTLGFRAATSPWVSDDMVPYEVSALHNLRELLHLNAELAHRLLGYTLTPPVWPSDVRIIYGLPVLWEIDADRFDRLISQPWFDDGLDYDERTLTDALIVAGIGERFLFDQLLTSHYTETAIITLPLAGEVRLTAFQSRPFPNGEYLLGHIEVGMRGAERFMKIPFPTNDVVVLLGGIAAGYSNQRLRLGRFGFERISSDLIIREVAHFYFTYSAGPHNADHQAAPLWLRDSGAEFIRAYIYGWLEPGSLPGLLNQWEDVARRTCIEQGFPNLHQLTVPDPPDKARWKQCTYILGRHMLLRLFEVLGEDATSSALREVYLISSQGSAGRDEHGIMRPSERDVYRIFLKHTSPSQKDTVRRVYQGIHGAPFVDAAN